MKLALIRHAESEGNAKRHIQGHEDYPLTEHGHEQAKAVGERFAHEALDRIYTSDLTRTYDTAIEIAKHHPCVPFETDERLRERNFGIYAGRARHELEEEGISHEALYSSPPGGETREEFRARILSVLDDLYEKHYGETIMLITHSGLIGRLLMTLANAPEEERDCYRPNNTSVTIIEFDLEKNHTLRLMNCCAHLEPIEQQVREERSSERRI
jgi:uncharacterized phosphatase